MPRLRLLPAAFFLFAFVGAVFVSQVAAQDRSRFPSGTECAAKMTVPPGFVVTCFASEPDVVNPLGIDFDSRGRVYVLECLTYPQKAPPGKGRDRIRIFEDTNGDGIADEVTTFAEGLNLATGLAVGYGGVFVGEAPELVFLEDTNGDDKADKRTVLLDGWGLQDTHETLNSFIWGPDGWLYGCHGVFTNSKVGKPGTPEKERVPLNAGIWRYKPKPNPPNPPSRSGKGGGGESAKGGGDDSSPSLRFGERGAGGRGVDPSGGKFELFAEGTSNPWGYDFDENGSGFLTACVIPHLFHIIPGGRYIRQAGQNFNPYNYGQIKEICDHVHYFGPSSHIGNKDPRRFQVGGGHAHSACLIYQGGSFPEEWHGRVFMNNIHGSRINTDILKKNGSTYIGSHGPDFLVANDPNFRAIQLRTGPDGSIFMTDWYDPQICHNTDAKIWDREHGRIYKVTYKGDAETRRRGDAGKERAADQRAAGFIPADLAKLSSHELVKLLTHKNSWQWRKALLILGERGDKSVVADLQEMARKSPDYRHSLRALWGLAYIGAFDEHFGVEMLRDGQPWVKVWAARLLAQLDAKLSAEARRLLKFRTGDDSPDVRLQIACACVRWQNLKLENDCSKIIEELRLNDEDLSDPVIPHVVWWAYQPELAGMQADTRALHLVLAAHVADGFDQSMNQLHIFPRIVRYLASTGKSEDLDAAIRILACFKQPKTCLASVDGLLEGLQGRRLEPPPAWNESLKKLRPAFDDDRPVSRRLTQVGIHFGDKDAVSAMEKEALDSKAGLRDRTQAIQSLSLARLPSSVEPLLTLSVGDSPAELRREALRALTNFDSNQVSTSLLDHWPKLPADVRKDVIVLLSARKPWAHALIDALQKNVLKREDLNENDIRRLLALKDAELAKKVESIWGKLREQTPAEVEKQLAKFRRQLAELPGDRKAGAAVFEKNCQVCHTLAGKGHQVGPDITGANRRDVEYLLINILDPNRVVGRDYYSAVAVDKSNAVHTGLLVEDTPQRIVLKGENNKLTTIPRSELDEMKIVEKSLMPEGLPNNMTEQEFRNLIAFLMEDPYLHRGLIAGPFKMALDAEGPIEKQFTQSADPLKTEGVKWKPFQLGPSAVIDMEKQGVLAPPTDSTAYVYFEVTSPRAVNTVLELAADENVKVWLNGKQVVHRTRSVEPSRTPVELKEGVNKLLIKVHNIYGPSWVWARLGDPERALEVTELKGP